MKMRSHRKGKTTYILVPVWGKVIVRRDDHINNKKKITLQSAPLKKKIVSNSTLTGKKRRKGKCAQKEQG